MSNPKKARTLCIQCGNVPDRPGYKYCSNRCQREYEYLHLIEQWKLGRHTGLLTNGVVSSFVKKYLRRKYSDQCCLCGWSKLNPKTRLVPLVADHIDGNWRNNAEQNLRLICPNCDALSPTYAGLNRGNGRKGRKMSERAKEGQRLRRNLHVKKRVRILRLDI